MSDILRTETKVIDGIEFSCTVFPAFIGFRIKGRLLKTIGPAIGKAVGGISHEPGKSILDSDISMAVIGNAVSGFCDSLDDEKTVELIKDLFKSTRIDGKAFNDAVFNIQFAGKYGTIYKALIFIIESNRFFGNRNIGNLFEKIETSTPNIPGKSKKEPTGI